MKDIIQIRFIFAIVLLTMIAAKCQKTHTFYVSNSGNDLNEGTINAPFETIDKAVRSTLEIRQKGYEGGFVVNLRSGQYDLSSTLLIENMNDLKLQSYQDENVIVTGGKTIPIEKIRSIENSRFQSDFDSTHRENIYFVDLDELSISDYGQMFGVGFGKSTKPIWMEVFINDKPGHLARWPNDSMIRIGDVIDPGSIPRNGDKSKRGAKFTYEVERPSRWRGETDAWISGYFNHGFADDAVKIARIDTANHLLSTVGPAHYGFASGKEEPWRRWYAFNLRSEIDRNLEYFIDRQKGLLFFYSLEPVTSLEVSILRDPLIVVKESNRIVVQNLKFKNTRGSGVEILDSKNTILSDCDIYNIGNKAVIVQSGNGELGQPHNNLITGCTIFNVGTGGILLAGGDRKNLAAANNMVENCVIHDFNRIERTYRPAIEVFGVGNSISHCELYNAPSSAILLHGNDHLVEFNNIYDVCQEIDDQGALYYGRNPSERGNVVRYNYFHHINRAYRTSAIYHDDGACGMTVYGNIFFKAGRTAVIIGGGSDNTYYNNLFMLTPRAISIDNRLQNWFSSAVASGGLFERRLSAINFTEPPYSEKYPFLAKYFDDNPAQPKRNNFTSNIFVAIPTTVAGDKQFLSLGEDNVTIDANVDFWIEVLKRSTIPSDSAFEKPNSWEALPVDGIGLIEKDRSKSKIVSKKR